MEVTAHVGDAVIVVHKCTKFDGVVLPVPKIWLIFGHGLSALVTLTCDLSTSKSGHGSSMSWASFLPIFSLLCLSILDLGSGAGQTDRHRQTYTDRQTDNGHRRLIPPPWGHARENCDLRWSSHHLRHPAGKMITISVQFIVCGTPRVLG